MNNIYKECIQISGQSPQKLVFCRSTQPAWYVYVALHSKPSILSIIQSLSNELDAVFVYLHSPVFLSDHDRRGDSNTS